MAPCLTATRHVRMRSQKVNLRGIVWLQEAGAKGLGQGTRISARRPYFLFDTFILLLQAALEHR